MEQHNLHIHAALIARCKTGDRTAYYELYKNYSRAMYNAAFRITGNEADAQDALQESFISAFKNLNAYRGDASFGWWLKRIVVNKALNLVAKRNVSTVSLKDDWDVEDQEEEESHYTDSLTVERVRRAIEQLPDGYRSVLSLYLIEGYDHQEIAEIMKITESTSKSQLNRAKSKLREILNADKVSMP